MVTKIDFIYKLKVHCDCSQQSMPVFSDMFITCHSSLPSGPGQGTDFSPDQTCKNAIPKKKKLQGDATQNLPADAVVFRFALAPCQFWGQVQGGEKIRHFLLLRWPGD